MFKDVNNNISLTFENENEKFTPNFQLFLNIEVYLEQKISK